MAEAKARRLYAKLQRTKAAEFYRAYFAPKVESIYSTVQTTGELHNFIYDLTERNLGYLAGLGGQPVRQVPGRPVTCINAWWRLGAGSATVPYADHSEEYCQAAHPR